MEASFSSFEQRGRMKFRVYCPAAHVEDRPMALAIEYDVGVCTTGLGCRHCLVTNSGQDAKQQLTGSMQQSMQLSWMMNCMQGRQLACMIMSK